MLSWSTSDPVPGGWAGASATSAHPDTSTAATEIADTLHDQFGTRPDLLIAFGSFQHVAAFTDAMDMLRRTLQPRCLLGSTAESILGDDEELDGVSGLSALALRLPDVRVTPWQSTPTNPLPLSRPEELPDRLGIEHDSKCVLLLADPFTTPTHRTLHALSSCNEPAVPIVGGLASGGSRPGINRLVLDDTFQTSGAVGVTLGAVDLGALVERTRLDPDQAGLDRADSTSYLVSAGWRLPPRLTLKAQAGRVDGEDFGYESDILVVGADYKLARGTKVYALLSGSDATVTYPGGADDDDSGNLFSVGMEHKF